MTLEELKAKKAEIDKQIREFKDIPAKTKNFQVVRESKNKLLLKFSLENMKPRILLCVRPWMEKDADNLTDDFCDMIDNLISQLESIKEQIGRK